MLKLNLNKLIGLNTLSTKLYEASRTEYDLKKYIFKSFF
jgi:hypothetical protein